MSSASPARGRSALVIGCGVSGLSCALRLREAGWKVRIVARELPPNTTSDVAAAVWYPYRAGPEHRVLGWGARAYDVFFDLARGEAWCGVELVEALEVLTAPAPEPWWRACVRDFRRARPDELPSGYVDGYVFATAIIEMPRYLRWLIDRVTSLGIAIEQRELPSLERVLDELASDEDAPDALVNCTGLGARSFVGDQAVIPVRGEVLRVDRPAVPIPCIFDEAEPRMAYVIPRSSDVVLGGTAVPGNGSLVPDDREAEAIRERCVKLVPALAGAALRSHVVGLRPGRHEVRVEREVLRGRAVVHNYGHGGAGVTLSWGCADEVVALLQSSGAGVKM